MKVSINDQIINKNENGANQSKGFKPADLTPQELADCISQGYAFSYQFEKAHRKADNFICSDIIAADFDSGMTLDEAFNNELFINNASILYTTASHTPEKHKFRIIFELPRTITDREEIRAAQQGLTRRFPADRAAVDPARQFYGSRGCSPHLFGRVLTETNLSELIALGKEPLNQTDNDGAKQRVAGTRGAMRLDDGIMVQTSRGELADFRDLPVPTPVFCPFHLDSSPSAFTTQSRYGVRGIRCSSCQQTFWEKQREPQPHDFYEFDKLAHAAHAAYRYDTYVEPQFGIEYDVPNPNLVISERYLHVDDIGVMKGITLIKSPKGSGKTQYLKKIVTGYKKQKLRVLLVGHRRSLLQALSSELGLTCYLDTTATNQSGVYDIDRYYAISIDSLATHLAPIRHKFDVVLIDESEQVFSHLIADTMDHERRRKSFLIFQHYINVAKTVIALDADLNTVTLHAIQRFGNKNPLIDRRYVLNEYKPKSSQVDLYANENHLVAEMLASLKNGHRVFIACNSKKRVEELVETIKGDFGEDFPMFSITSANSQDPQVIDFIRNIKTDILKYQALLVSPAMGTGIDITFPENLPHVDGVYGFFYAKVNTHYEVDQQIARVRHPNYIRVWISSETFNFEYEVDPIRQELVESGIVPELLLGYESDGTPKFNWADPFLTLHATILAAQRASKNALKENFVRLRKHNGWDVVDVVKDLAMASIGAVMSGLGKDAALQQYITGILSAPSITWEQANALSARRKQGKLSSVENNSLEKYWIERFYCEKVTEQLLRDDKRGKYRNQIKMLEGVLASKAKVGKVPDEAKILARLFDAADLLDESGRPNPETVIKLDALVKFVTFCIRYKAKIERLLNVAVRKDVKWKPVAQLNAFLDLCGLKMTNFNTVVMGDKKVYEYHLERVSYDGAMSLIAERSKPTDPVEDETERRGACEAPDPLDKH